MKRSSGLLILLLISHAAALAQDEVRPREPSCVSLRQLDEIEIIDSRNLAFVMKNGDIYLNRLDRTCTGLRPGETIGYRTGTGRLCGIDVINVLSDFPRPFTTVNTCGLGGFEPINEDTLAILMSEEEGISLSELGGPVEDGDIAANLTGDWVIASSIGEAPIEVHCQLIQSGAELTGTCTPVMEDPQTSELTGMVDGNQAEWSYDVFFNGNPGYVAYAGTLESDSVISGTLDLSGTPTEFTATRQD